MLKQTLFFTLTLEQGQELIATTVAEQLKPLYEAMRLSNVGKQTAKYLTTEQTLAYLHLSKPTLNKLRREDLVVSIQCSDNRVLYDRDQLDTYLQSKMEKGKRHV